MLFAKLFRSRWSAALWAAGVLWTAYDVAGAAPGAPDAADQPVPVDAAAMPLNAADLATLEHFGDGHHR